MQPENRISIPDKIVAATQALGDKPSEEIRQQLISLINELINNDFDALVQLLYKIDVDEKKLKQHLKTYADLNSASIIADLIINRQLQKAATKKQFDQSEESATDDTW